jgi:hypothetical protein
MIKVTAPAWVKERETIRYILEWFINDASATYEWEEDKIEIEFHADRSIRCPCIKPENYIKEVGMREFTKFLKFFIESDESEENNNYESHRHINIDILLGIFYILTFKYEEVDNNDIHKRYIQPEEVMNILSTIPVIDAWRTKVIGNIPKEKFSYNISCDLDWPVDPCRSSIIYRIVKCKKILYKDKGKADPYIDALNFQINEVKKAGGTLQINLIVRKTSMKDQVVDLQKYLEELNKDDVEFGLHLGYNTYNKINEIRKAVKIYKNLTGNTVVKNRMHYLRFSPDITSKLLESCGISEDSTIGYHNHAGFRLGTARKVRLYDRGSQKFTNVIEAPLIIMESTIIDYNNDTESKLKRFDEIITACKKYSGEINLLWHNSRLIKEEDRALFKEVLKCLKK